MYKAEIYGNDSSVFCVSNTTYWGHRDLPKPDSMPHLELSGLLAVRRHCISIVSDSQLRYAIRFMEDEIPAHLSAVELWVQSAAGSATPEARDAVREALERVDRALRRVSLLSFDCLVSRIPGGY